MRYVRPDESIIGMAVAGTVDADYLASWLTDGRPGYPVRTTGNLSLTVTVSPSLNVDVVAVTHHNIRSVASITLGGSLSTSIATDSVLPDDIPENWYRVLETPVSTSSIVLGVTGNPDPIVVGELYAGASRTLPALRLGRRLAPDETFPWEGEYEIVPPYDPGIAPGTRVSGSFILSETQLNDVEAWHRSQRKGSLPTLIIPDYPVGRAWLCVFNYTAEDFVPGEAPGGSPAPSWQALFLVTLQVVVVPGIRW